MHSKALVGGEDNLILVTIRKNVLGDDMTSRPGMRGAYLACIRKSRLIIAFGDHGTRIPAPHAKMKPRFFGRALVGWAACQEEVALAM